MNHLFLSKGTSFAGFIKCLLTTPNPRSKEICSTPEVIESHFPKFIKILQKGRNGHHLIMFLILDRFDDPLEVRNDLKGSFEVVFLNFKRHNHIRAETAILRRLNIDLFYKLFDLHGVDLYDHTFF